MCSLKKNCLIFNVSQNAKNPFLVINQKDITGEDSDSMVPLLGVYDGSHYESLYPATEKDEELTVEFVKHFPDFRGNFKEYMQCIANNKDTVNISNVNDELSGTLQHILGSDKKNSSGEWPREISEISTKMENNTDVIVKKEVISDIKDNSINTVTDKSEDENEVTNCSDIFSQETQEVSEIDVSEVTDSSDILPQKTEEVSQIDGGEVVKKEVIYDIKDNSINTITDKSEDENEVTNCSDIFSQETQEVSEIDVSEVTDSSDILPQKTEEVSQIDGGEVTNSSDIWPQKTQKCSEKDGSEVTNSSNILPQKTQTISDKGSLLQRAQYVLDSDGSEKESISSQGAKQETQRTANKRSKKGGPNKPIFKDNPISIQVTFMIIYLLKF